MTCASGFNLLGPAAHGLARLRAAAAAAARGRDRGSGAGGGGGGFGLLGLAAASNVLLADAAADARALSAVRFSVLRGALAHERREVGGRVPIDGAVGVVGRVSR